jgi:glycosyltransferase involved in cell wall biosynthesis
VIETIGRGGGAEQLLATLLPALRDMGVDVELVALFDWHDDLADELQARGVVVHRLGIAGPGALASGMAKFARLVLNGRYELFWGHLRFGNFYARFGRLLRRGSKLAATFHSNDLWARSQRPSRRRVDLERLLLSGADTKVAVSEALRTDYRQRLGWTDMQVIHNGIDVEAVRSIAAAADRAAVRRAWHIGADEFLIVTPARLIAVKGQKYLLDAMSLLNAGANTARLVLCGEGDDEAQLRAQADFLGLGERVIFAGLQSHDQLVALIAAADAVVMPSLYESFGLVAVEAMAAMTPAIVTNVDGFREVVGNSRSALVVEPASSTALAEAVRALMTDPNLRARLVQAGKKRAPKFDIQLCANNWLDLLSSLG